MKKIVYFCDSNSNNQFNRIMQRSKFYNLLVALTTVALSAGFVSCSDDDNTPPTPPEPPVEPEGTPKLYVLNEGQWGQNNASIDMLDFETGDYTADAYAIANPTTVLELGDVGNDLVIAGDRMYAVINGSHKVQVIDANACVDIAKIDVNSPRAAVVVGENLYVSSWVGGDGNLGSVVKIDLTTNQVVGSVAVGIHPERMAVSGGKLYVTSSQDYATQQYDDRLFVVDIPSFTVDGFIRAGINQTDVQLGADNKLYVVSAGNYADVASSIYVVDLQSNNHVSQIDMPVTKLALYQNQAYVLASTYDANWQPTYSIKKFNLDTPEQVSDFGILGNNQFETPYAIAVDPTDGTVYVSDARDYTSSGSVMAFDANGNRLATYSAGVCPGHFAFYLR